MAFCISCGTKLPDEAKFCTGCGAPVVQATPTCAGCGAELLEGAKFCTVCGTPVGAAAEPPAPAYSVATSEPTVSNPATPQQQAAAQSQRGLVDGNRVACAFCGVEAEKDNVPSDWFEDHPVYVCPNCSDKQNTYTIEDYQDYCRNNGIAEGSVTELEIPQGFTDVYLAVFDGECLEPVSKLVLPEGIVFISCAQLPNLTEVSIPHSCKLIGSSAFSDCAMLKSVVIPENVTHIGDWAFSSCESLKTVTIPESVVEIGAGAFLMCKSLETVIMKSSTPPTYREDASGEIEDTFEENAPWRKVIVPKGSLAAYKNAPGWKNISNLCEEDEPLEENPESPDENEAIEDETINDEVIEDETDENETAEDETIENETANDESVGGMISEIGKVYAETFGEIKDAMKDTLKDTLGAFGLGGLFGKKKK